MKYFFLMLYSSSSFASGFSGPLGDTWEDYSTLTVNKAVALTTNTAIRVDRLILKAPIITNGFKLNIESKEIEIGPKGKIMAFDGPAPRRLDTPPPPSNMGARGIGVGGHGGPGEQGSIGLKGVDGQQSPQAISINTLSIIGQLEVNGTGQTGGKGGQGGPGGQGGAGNKGRNATVKIKNCFCELFNNVHESSATKGGDGGVGGIGGNGGPGGSAGRNVQLNFLLPLKAVKYVTKHGQPGEGGEPGDNGPSGIPGKGGNGDSDKMKCLLYKCSESLPEAPAGTAKTLHEPKEDRKKRYGQPGREESKPLDTAKVASITELRNQKVEVYKKISNFHLQRLYLVLLQDSLRAILNFNFTRKQVSNLDQEMAGLLTKASKEVIHNVKEAWSHSFSQLNLHNRHVKNAIEVISLLEDLENEKLGPLILAKQLNKNLKVAEAHTGVALKKLSVQCLRYKKELSENRVASLFSLLHIPMCTQNELTAMLKNPRRTIKVNSLRKGLILPENAMGDIKIHRVPVNLERTLAQSSDIIFLNNKKYTTKDVLRINPNHSNASLKAGLLSLGLPTEKKMNLKKLKALIKVYRIGVTN